MYTIIEHRPDATAPIQTINVATLSEAGTEARRIAHEIAGLDGHRPVWRDAESWHDQDGMPPLGGYDVGPQDENNPSVVIYGPRE